MLSLTISSQEALSHISVFKLHPWYSVLVLGVILAIVVETYTLFSDRDADKTMLQEIKANKVFYFGIYPVINVIITAIVFGVIFIATPIGKLNQKQVDYLWQAPRVTKTQTINLVGVNTSGTISTNFSGSRYYLSASSSDSTSYSYIADLGNGRYQQTTLTDAFGKQNIDPHQIFVQESKDVKQPKLVVESSSFKSRTVAHMLAGRDGTAPDETSDYGNRMSYTFYVPSGTVKQSSSIK